MNFDFKINYKETDSSARTGEFKTPHGTFKTPVFMPVGTRATIKTLTPEIVNQTKAQIILCNAYHLFLRPGTELIKKAGGIHKFMGWDKPILTDSGGYQVFSLPKLTRVLESGVEFQSHIDGTYFMLTPKDVINIQKDIGSDIIMPLDQPVPYPSPKEIAEDALARTIKWAELSIDHWNENRNGQLLFGLLQGSIYEDLRLKSIEKTVSLGFDAYSIGGLSVGEEKNDTYKIVKLTCDNLPEKAPRYLMGVGTPLDILECVERGVDMFDCILPTRVGRNGWAFTKTGVLKIRNNKYKEDLLPIDETCNCYACKNFSRAYVRHLFNVGEMLGAILMSIHNMHFYQNLMKEIRDSIEENNFSKYKADFILNYNRNLSNG